MENPPLLIGKPSINGPFSMAMLNNQRVIVNKTIQYAVFLYHPSLLQ
jgi:hypothetical protein